MCCLCHYRFFPESFDDVGNFRSENVFPNVGKESATDLEITTDFESFQTRAVTPRSYFPETWLWANSLTRCKCLESCSLSVLLFVDLVA